MLPSQDELDEIMERARAFCGFPRVMDPELVTDPDRHRHADRLAGEYGFWEPSENRVFINIRAVEAKLGAENLEALIVYQLLHYALAPFETRTAIRLVGSAMLAMEELRDRDRKASYREAMSVERLFCDIIDLTYAASHGMREECVSLYRAMDRTMGDEGGVTWRFLLCCYEELWGCPGALDAPRSGGMREDARRLADRLLDRPFAAAGWESKIRKLVKYLLKYSDDPSDMDRSRLMDNGIDDLDQATAEKVLSSLVRDMGMKDFKELVGGLGAGSETQAVVWYYRELSRAYEVRFHPVRSEAGEAVPHAPLAWGMADPFESLDLPYTLYTSGKAVPTLTTKQWEKTALEVAAKRRSPPDVVVILDASGSMTNPVPEVANAVLAGFVMARSAGNLGAKVGLVVYSDKTRTHVVEPVWNIGRIEEGLVTYYGGGTVFPVGEVKRLASTDAHRPKHFCLISDTEITNIAEASRCLGDALRVHPENSGSVFLIDQPESEKAEIIREAGYEIFPVSRGRDLVNIVAGKAREIYS